MSRWDYFLFSFIGPVVNSEPAGGRMGRSVPVWLCETKESVATVLGNPEAEAQAGLGNVAKGTVAPSHYRKQDMHRWRAYPPPL